MKRVTEGPQVQRVQQERKGQEGIRGCRAAQGTSACKAHLVYRGKEEVQALPAQRAGGGREDPTARWGSQAPRVPRVNGVILAKKEMQDS